MSLPLSGRRIALAESRQLEELAALLEKEGAIAVRCPLVSILDADDPVPVRHWLDELLGCRFDYVIFMTGEGVRRLIAFAERAGKRDGVIAALSATKIVTRGPKPVKVLKEIGLAPTLVAAAPTSEGIVTTLSNVGLKEQGVGVQFHGEISGPLLDFLKQAGARVSVVQPYRYAPASDGDRVAELILEMVSGSIDLIVFTSTPQVERLHEVANERSLCAELNAGMGKTRVAAVGPIAADSVREHGWRVDIVPDQGFVMKNLVQYIKREFGRNC